MSSVLGDRVIGICDSPVGLCRRVAAALGVDASLATFDYVGLNHLGWLRRVLVGGRDLLPSLFEDGAALTSFEEGNGSAQSGCGRCARCRTSTCTTTTSRSETLEQIQNQQSTRGEFLSQPAEILLRTDRRQPGGGFAVVAGDAVRTGDTRTAPRAGPRPGWANAPRATWTAPGTSRSRCG